MGCETWASLSLLLPPPPSEWNESPSAEMRDMEKEPRWLARCVGEQGMAPQRLSVQEQSGPRWAVGGGKLSTFMGMGSQTQVAGRQGVLGTD